MNKIENMIMNMPLIKLGICWLNEVYSLLEKFNITWSVKVKTVYWILKDAIEKWQLSSGKIVLEASSGNTAIALAYFGNMMNFQVSIILPTTTAPCKKQLIRSFGADIIEVEWITDDCINLRDKMFAENPDLYYLPDQFKNYANMWAHYNLTWPYIQQKLWKIDFWCAGLGTSWTLLWTAKYLKEQNPNIKVIWINPIEKVEWLRNFKTSTTNIPFYKEYNYLIDEVVDVTFADSMKWVNAYLQEWYFVWISSWAIIWWLKQYLLKYEGLKWVVIAPDGGDYYFDTLIKNIDLNNYQGCK